MRAREWLAAEIAAEGGWGAREDGLATGFFVLAARLDGREVATTSARLATAPARGWAAGEAAVAFWAAGGEELAAALAAHEDEAGALSSPLATALAVLARASRGADPGAAADALRALAADSGEVGEGGERVLATAVAALAFSALEDPEAAQRAVAALQRARRHHGWGSVPATLLAGAALHQAGQLTAADLAVLRAAGETARERWEQALAAWVLLTVTPGDGQARRMLDALDAALRRHVLIDASREVRDTAAVLEAVSRQPLGPAELAALRWLGGQPAEGLDSLEAALRLGVLARLAPAPSGAVADLTARQGADGGFPLRPGHRSDPLTTARAVAALADAGMAESDTVRRGVDRLAEGAAGVPAGFSWEGGSSVFLNGRILGLLGPHEEALGPRAATPMEAARLRLADVRLANGTYGSTLETAAALGGLLRSAVRPAALAVRQTLDRLLEAQADDGSFDGDPYLTGVALWALTGVRANLAVSDAGIRLSEPRPARGQAVDVTVTVDNRGVLDAPPSTVHFFLGHPDAGGVPLGEPVAVPRLLAEAEAELTVPWNTGERAGRLALCVLVDAGDEVPETDEDDNLRCRDVQVRTLPNLTASPADLVVDPPLPRADAPFTITAAAHNPLLDGAAGFSVRLLVVPGPADGLASWDGETIPARGSARYVREVAADELSPGTYDLCLDLDADDDVTETDEDDNLVCTTLSVLSGEGYDLRITDRDLTAEPAAPLLGQAIELTAEVFNAGTVASPVAELLFLLEHATLGVDVPAGPLATVPAIPPGESRAVRLRWDPGLLAGAVAVTAWVDPFDRLDELAINNNLAYLRLPIGALDLPDLDIRPEDVLATPAPLAGQPAPLAVTVRNLGGAPADGVLVRIHDGPPEAGGRQVGGNLSISRVPPLSEALLLVPATFSAGRHELHVLVDPSDLIEESIEDNNRTVLGFVVLPGAGTDPAVVPDGIEVLPDPPRELEPATIRVTVANLGGDPAPEVPVELRRGDPPDDAPLGRAATPPLPAGTEAPAFLPVRLARGLVALTAHVDPDAALPDADRTNNRASRTLRVVADGPADLAVHPLDLTWTPGEPVELEPVEVRGLVHNVGSQAAPGVPVAFRFGLPGEGGVEIERTRLDVPGGGQAAATTRAALGAGTQTICLVVDPDGEVPEHDESDNVACARIDVSPPGDLAVRAAGITTDPAIPIAGSPFVVRVEVDNVGVRPVPAGSAVELRLDPAGEARVLGRQPVPPLAAGERVTVDLPVDGIEGGFAVFSAVADPEGVLSELQEANNRADRRLFVAFPDRAELLAVPGSACFEPRRPRPGEGLDLLLDVNNYGSVDAVGVGVAFYLGEPDDDVLIGSMALDRLGPGDTGIGYAAWEDPPEGVHVVTIVVNQTAAVPETSHDDNVARLEVSLENRRPALAWSNEGPETSRRGVVPYRGHTETDFSFRIRYQDPDGDLPAEGFPRVVLDLDGDGEVLGTVGGVAEGARVLEEVDPADADPADGKLYAVTVRLPPGRRSTYRFEVEDVFGATAEEEHGPLAGSPGPWVTDVPVAVGMPAYPSWPGNPVTVWGRVFPGPDPDLTWRWDFGDGSPAAEGAVDDPAFVVAGHTYPALGTYTARLTVTDGAGLSDTAEVTVRVEPGSPDVRRRAAIEDGLRALYRWRRDDGTWTGIDNSTTDATRTAVALLAFENNRHFEDDDPAEHVYAWGMRRGFDLLLSRMETHHFGGAGAVYDRNRNGVGVFWPGTMYDVTLSLYPFLASDNPAAYRELVQDTADWLLWAQNHDGGWRYSPHYGASDSSDTSVLQWPVLALSESALCPFSADVPYWVWTDTDRRDPYGYGVLHWLDLARNHQDGGFGYLDGRSTPVLTSAGAISLWAAGRPVDDPWVRAALDFYDQRWDAEDGATVWFADLYLAYGFMKMMRLYDLDLLGERDWFSELVTVILDLQDSLLHEGHPAGHLVGDASYIKDFPAISTAFGVLILTKAVIGLDPVADAGPDRIVVPGEEVCLDGSGSHHLNRRRVVLGHAWDLDGDGEPDAQGVTPCTSFEPGDHEVTLSVHDNDLCEVKYATDRARVRATLDNHPPVARLVPVGTAFVRSTVTFDARPSSDPDDDPLTFSWDLDGDGDFDDGEGATVQRRYDGQGQVSVGVEVSDGEYSDTARTVVDIVDLRLSGAGAAPDPFSPGASPGRLDDSLLRVRLSRAARVQVALHAGDGSLVRTLGPLPGDTGVNALVWDGRDDGGDPVGSGRYLYRITTPGVELPGVAGWVVEDDVRVEAGAGARAGGVADPDVFRWTDASYRMLLTGIGEDGVPRILSASSEDGEAWQVADGVRIDAGGVAPHAHDVAGAAAPALHRLPDGRFRVYYVGTDAGGVRRVLSATSDDAVTFVKEAGARVDVDAGPDLAGGVGAPAVLSLPGDEVRLYLTATDGDGVTRVSSATSGDGVGFVLDAGARLEPAAGDDLSGGVGDPAAWRDPDTGRVQLAFAAVAADGRAWIGAADGDDGLDLGPPRPLLVDAAGEEPSGGRGPSHVFVSDGTERLFYSADEAGLPAIRSARFAAHGTVEVDDVQPTADLTPPPSADLDEGVVPVFGSATDRAFDGTHRNFLAYTLAVRAPDGTETTLARADRPVEDGLLGVWDASAEPGGTYRLLLSVEDAAGNLSEAEREVQLAGDGCTAPVIHWPGARPGEPVTALGYTVAVAGAANPGATVTVAVDGAEQGRAVAAEDGRWEVARLELSEGANLLTATTCPGAVATLEVRVDLFTLEVAVDAPRYDPGATVQVTVRAVADRPERRAEVVVEGPADGLPVVLGAVPADGVPRLLTWRVGSAPPGAYRAGIRAYRDLGDDRVLEAATAPFDVAGTPELVAELTTDRLGYAARTTVVLRGRVVNASPNAAASGVETTLQVAPDGGAPLAPPEPDAAGHGPLLPDDVAVHLATWDTALHPPGEYLATLTATRDGGAGPVVAVARFSVVPTSDDGAGLAGALTADPAAAVDGAPVTLSWAVDNAGNADLAGLPVRIRVLSPASGEEVARPLDTTEDLPAGGQTGGEAVLETAALRDGQVLAVLRAETGDGERTLGAAPIDVRRFGAEGDLGLTPPVAVGLLSGPDAAQAGERAARALAAAGWDLQLAADAAALSGLLDAQAGRLVLLRDPGAALPPPFDGLVPVTAAEGVVRVEVVASRLVAPARLLLDTGAGPVPLALAPAAGEAAETAGPVPAGTPLRLVLRVFGHELGRPFGVFEAASDGPLCHVEREGPGRFSVACTGLPAGVVGPGGEGPGLQVRLETAVPGAPAAFEGTLDALVRGGAGLLSLATPLAGRGAPLLGVTVRARLDPGERSLRLAAPPWDAGQGPLAVAGPVLELSAAEAEVVGWLSGGGAPAGPVSAVVLPAEGRLQVEVERLSRVVAQSLRLVAPHTERLAWRLSPGGRYSTSLPLAAGAGVVLRLGQRTLGIGGDGLEHLDSHGPGATVERLGLREWRVTFAALPPALQGLVPEDQGSSVLRLTAEGEGLPEAPAAVLHPAGRGRALTLAVDAAGEPEPGFLGLLAAAVPLIAGPAERTAPGDLVRVSLQGRGGATEGLAELVLTLPDGAAAVHAPGAAVDGLRVSWAGVELGGRRPFSRSLVCRLPDAPGEAVFSAEVRREDRPEEVFPLTPLVVEVAEP